MATPAQRTNTWTLDQWYDQSVAGTTGGYQWGAQIWSWGYNRDGSLGLNGNNRSFDRSSPTQIGTDADWKWIGGLTGYNLTAGKKDGSMWSAGNSWNGSLGLSEVQVRRSSPVQMPGSYKGMVFATSAYGALKSVT